MAKIFGPSGFVPSTMDQVLGRFNDAIRGRSFIFLDEVLFSGDRRAADAIKSLLHAPSWASRRRACRSSNARSPSICGSPATTIMLPTSKNPTPDIGS